MAVDRGAARRLTLPAAGLDRRWVGVLAAVSAAGALASAVVAAVVKVQIDITVYLLGARHFFDPHLYSLRTHDTGLLFTYPPFAALVFLPLAHLPALAARVVWAVVNAASLVALLAVSVRAVRPSWPAGRVWRAALLCSGPAALLNPVFVTLQLGQVNLVLALLVAVDVLRDRPLLGGRVPPGALVGVAAAVKLTPLILVPYLFLLGRRRAAAWAVGTFVACGALTTALSPAASKAYWTSDVFQPDRAGGLSYISNQNLSSILERFHHAALPGTVVWPLAAALCVSGLALAVVAYRRSSPMLGLLVCETTGLCVSPVTWVHHLVWVVPAIVWLALAPDRPALGRWFAAVTAVLFWAAPVWWVPKFDLRELHENAWQLAAGNSFFLAMAAFLVAVAFHLGRRGRPSRTPSLP